MLCLRVAATLLLIGSAIAPALAAEDPPATADQNAQTPATGSPTKPAQTTPPYPRDGTDLKTQIREQQEYMVWMYENTANQDLVVIQLRPGIEERPRQLISSDRARAIGSAARIDLKPQSLVGLPDTQVFQIPMKVTEKALAEQICIDLKKHPDVASCDPGGSADAFGIPTDALYASQWSFQTGPGGANIHKAWDTTTGAATTVVAILDTGVTPHEDLAGVRLLPGYDFVSDPVVANDGGGRDADPSDSGNWVTEAERNGSGSLRNCMVQNSSCGGTWTEQPIYRCHHHVTDAMTHR